MAWAILGPSPYRSNRAMEVMGTATGMLLAYLVLLRSASSRAKALRR